MEDSPTPLSGDQPEKYSFSRLSRRRLLQLAGVTGAVAGLPGVTGAQSDTEEQNNGDAQFFEDGAEIALERVADGLTAPTNFADPQDDRDRWFVTDQPGQAYYKENGELQEFVDVSDRMVELGNIYGQYPLERPGIQYDERGLLGIEFHPNFAENRRFYLRYSAPPDDDLPDGWDHYNILSELVATEGLNSADLDSERELFRIPHPQMNHNAGPLAFGPDGYLYMPMGDGGGANDDFYGHVEDWYGLNAGGNGQDVSENLLGNILRIDVDGGDSEASPVRTGTDGDEDRPYGIPEDNPLVDVDGANDELYAWGLRNPYGVSFDENGNLFAPDAGQALYEEINVILRGGNYGWNLKEGTHCFDAANQDNPPMRCPDFAPSKTGEGVEPLIDPIVEFPHRYQGKVIAATVTGGGVYEGEAIPELRGSYVFPIPAQTPFQGEELNGRIITATPPDGEIGEITLDDLESDFPSDAEVPPEYVATGEDEVSEDEQPPSGLFDTNNEKNEIPRDRLWDMAQTVVAGTEDGAVPGSVRYIGRDQDGELYALTANRPIPAGNTGEVHKIVPPDKGGR